jgi:four helix bundle protein
MQLTELEVWIEAMQLVVDVYQSTKSLPQDEIYGLRMQIRRAAVSVVSNIAEGEGRRGRRDHARFVLTARGSLYELKTQITLCERLGYLSLETSSAVLERAEAVGRLVNGTLRFLARAANRQPPTAKRRAPRSPLPE